jgi:hypothetical protein
MQNPVALLFKALLLFARGRVHFGGSLEGVALDGEGT